MKIESCVEFGKEYESKVSGAKGACIAVTKWQYGCIRVALQPRIDKDGKVPEQIWVDAPELIGVEPQGAEPGGPRPASMRNSDPPR